MAIEAGMVTEAGDIAAGDIAAIGVAIVATGAAATGAAMGDTTEQQWLHDRTLI
jgi:hypothetical protein